MRRKWILNIFFQFEESFKENPRVNRSNVSQKIVLILKILNVRKSYTANQRNVSSKTENISINHNTYLLKQRKSRKLRTHGEPSSGYLCPSKHVVILNPLIERVHLISTTKVYSGRGPGGWPLGKTCFAYNKIYSCIL